MFDKGVMVIVIMNFISMKNNSSFINTLSRYQDYNNNFCTLVYGSVVHKLIVVLVYLNTTTENIYGDHNFVTFFYNFYHPC